MSRYRFCTRCGQPVRLLVEVCGHCGRRDPQPNRATHSDKRSKSPKSQTYVK